ncbi:type II secretion system minor pseudopilin GspJ [Woodsholea maritima]|uniref:type II secretion system minor pseudopilin GspJ n=1 Tax=Woodsholea maritima TaxID=240237 RepID=UPI00036317E3|nr:type II secretion system minor pseudopilin GspJ [Woodsholea maritima]
MRMPSNPREAGFSLIEVLAAVFVFGLVSAMSVALLTQALRAKEVQEGVQGEMAQVQALRLLLREDMGQVVLRPYRASDGRFASAVFVGDIRGVDPARRARVNEAVEILTFTRGGWSNPGAIQPRSSLQRVSYLLDGDTLYRQAWLYPDVTPEAEPVRMVVLEGLEDLELEFLYANRWQDQAEILALGGTGQVSSSPPLAVRLRYTLPGLGAMEHIVRLGVAARA